MVKQLVALAKRGVDIPALRSPVAGEQLGQAGLERRVHQVRAAHLVRHFAQAVQIHRSVYPVQIRGAEVELLQQEIGDLLRAIVGDFQPHCVAEVAVQQLALHRDAQILDLLLVHEQV